MTIGHKHKYNFYNNKSQIMPIFMRFHYNLIKQRAIHCRIIYIGHQTNTNKMLMTSCKHACPIHLICSQMIMYWLYNNINILFHVFTAKYKSATILKFSIASNCIKNHLHVGTAFHFLCISYSISIENDTTLAFMMTSE